MASGQVCLNPKNRNCPGHTGSNWISIRVGTEENKKKNLLLLGVPAKKNRSGRLKDTSQKLYLYAIVSGQKKECEDVDDDSLLHDIRLLKQVCQFVQPLVLVHDFVNVPRLVLQSCLFTHKRISSVKSCWSCTYSVGIRLSTHSGSFGNEMTLDLPGGHVTAVQSHDVIRHRS